MKIALFTNIDSKPFVWYYDGKKHTFKPGQQKMMQLPLAMHFSKHLTNQILTSKGQYSSCSPKKPNDVPEYMTLFKQICQVQEDGDEDTDMDETEASIEAATYNSSKTRTPLDSRAPQMIKFTINDPEEDEEKPVTDPLERKPVSSPVDGENNSTTDDNAGFDLKS